MITTHLKTFRCKIINTDDPPKTMLRFKEAGARHTVRVCEGTMEDRVWCRWISLGTMKEFGSWIGAGNMLGLDGLGVEGKTRAHNNPSVRKRRQM